MLTGLIEFSLKNRFLVLAITAVVSVLGLASALHLPIDAVPDVTNVQVSVLTSAPGLSPAEVEQYLTHPIETAMNGLPGLVEIRSISRTAVSAVTVIFDDDTSLARSLAATMSRWRS